MIRIACFGMLVDASEATYEFMFGCFWGRPTHFEKIQFDASIDVTEARPPL